MQIHVCRGSNILLPGVETDLKGQWALKWTVEKLGSAAPASILDYHYGSLEAEVQRNYEDRVNLSFTNGSLLLFNVTTQDSGRYTLDLMFEGKTYVHILKVVEPVSEIEVERFWNTSECYVRCRASGDIWNMTWQPNGSEFIQNITRLGNISELIVKVDSDNTYTCVAWNPVSELQKAYHPALEDPVGLLFIGLLVAAVIFRIPTIFSLATRLLGKPKCCQNAKTSVTAEWPVLVSWFLFLICSVVSASIAMFSSDAHSASGAQSASIAMFSSGAQSTSIVYPSTVPYGSPVLNIVYLVILTGCFVLDLLLLLTDRLKIWPKRCSGSQGAMQFVQIGLHLFALGFFVATLIYYFNTYFTACRRPHGFALTIFISVLVPVAIIALVYCVFRSSRLNGRLGDGAEKHPPEGIEMKQNAVNATLDRPARYATVATEEEFDAP